MRDREIEKVEKYGQRRTDKRRSINRVIQLRRTLEMNARNEREIDLKNLISMIRDVASPS